MARSDNKVPIEVRRDGGTFLVYIDPDPVARLDAADVMRTSGGGRVLIDREDRAGTRPGHKPRLTPTDLDRIDASSLCRTIALRMPAFVIPVERRSDCTYLRAVVAHNQELMSRPARFDTSPGEIGVMNARDRMIRRNRFSAAPKVPK